MSEQVAGILARAQACRDAGDWRQAILLFRQARELAPASGSIDHNLALSHFALGEAAKAAEFAGAALRKAPRQWQSRAVLAKVERSLGRAVRAHEEWTLVLREVPGNPLALAGLADIEMNEFGDPEAASALVRPLLADPASRADAELTSLMAGLYLGEERAEALSARLRAFSEAHLRLPPFPPRQPRTGRRRIGLISPLFSASPVYYLTYSIFAAIGGAHDLIFFNRGSRSDDATRSFREIAAEWHEVGALEPPALAQTLRGADIDILFDLGGWADVPALAALSAKPAARMYKWVGGQSATTGLSMFDGWIGDEWQSPPELAPLYAEPVVNMVGGYIDYAPPPALARLRDLPKHGVGLVGNPAKIGPKTIAAWPSGVDTVRLIDRRYKHEKPLARITALLAAAGIKVEEVIVPQGHDSYLRALGSCEAIVNTQPYAAGLTAVEAHHLGVRLLSGGEAGALFCSRHHLSHERTGGRNPRLAGQMLKLVSE
ncbi:MAG TPA: hypothetical protein VNT25_05400 [Allosphingosinicella sp.]|nr:hypothetical protein [Allosphingosinicella sp.]